jgi:hypothetical protein
MWGAYLGFVGLAVNPFGGLLFAVPYAKLVLGISPWIAAVVGVPLAYVQVVVVDLFFTTLLKFDWWHRLIQRRRTPRLERIVSSPHMFWLIALLGAFMGPWLVMAVMRYAQVPQRRIALPMLISLSWNAAAIALATIYAPRLLPR